MTEQEMFEQMLKKAIEDPLPEPPQDPQEFDIYSDDHRNIYMYIKGEWTNTGLNATSLV